MDHRTDVFSLGVMLYEMASGRRPFAGNAPVELGSAILRDTPPNLTSLRAGLPDGLARVGRAISYLEQAYASDSQRLGWLGRDRIFDPLRPDPRFAALLEKLSFEG